MYAARVQGAVSPFHKTKRPAAAIGMNRTIPNTPNTPNTLHHHHLPHLPLLRHAEQNMIIPDRVCSGTTWGSIDRSKVPTNRGVAPFAGLKQNTPPSAILRITELMLPTRVETDGLLRVVRGISVSACKTAAWVKTHERLTNKQHTSGSIQPPLLYALDGTQDRF